MELIREITTAPKAKPPVDKLGFGVHFSDHMFVSDYNPSEGWHADRIVPYRNFSLDPAAAALHYGQTLFEGMKAFRGVDNKIRLFRPEMNFNRLQAGAARLVMQSPPLKTFINGVIELVKTEREWIPSKEGTALYIRPTLIGTEGFLGVRPSSEILFYVITSPVGGYYGAKIDPVSIWIETKYSRAAVGGIGSVKAGGNYASSLLAAQEAKKKGFSQVLWLDGAEKRFVEEVGTMNVFFVQGDKVITPALNGRILPGVMRDSAIHYLESQGITVEQRPVEVYEILKGLKEGVVTEAFGTGTAAAISPIASFGTETAKLSVGTGEVGPITSQLMHFFSDLYYGRIEDNFGWTLDIDQPYELNEKASVARQPDLPAEELTDVEASIGAVLAELGLGREQHRVTLEASAVCDMTSANGNDVATSSHKH